MVSKLIIRGLLFNNLSGKNWWIFVAIRGQRLPGFESTTLRSLAKCHDCEAKVSFVVNVKETLNSSFYNLTF